MMEKLNSEAQLSFSKYLSFLRWRFGHVSKIGPKIGTY